MNRESERKRLVEQIKESLNKHIGKSCLLAENITSDLLDNGIVVPLVKVGQTVYYVSDNPFNLSVQANTIYEAEVVRIVTTHLGTTLVIQIYNEYGCTEIPHIHEWQKNSIHIKRRCSEGFGGKGR